MNNDLIIIVILLSNSLSNYYMTYELHAIVIARSLPLKESKEISQKFINNPNKHFYRETEVSYRFRAEPKTKFDSFKSKNIDDEVTLIFGTPNN